MTGKDAGERYGPLEERIHDDVDLTCRLGVPTGAAVVECGGPLMNITIRSTDAPDEATRSVIIAGLIGYNQAKTGRKDARALVVAIEDEQGQVIGGLWGRTSYDWLFVELLFVPDALRGQGVGTDLMRRAEAEALARGCHSVWLDTFEFQARGFYERLGYTCFAELANYPAGFSRYFMTRTLGATADGRV